MNLNFPKEEKLKSRKLIGEIFSKGAVVKSFPIRIQFVFHDNADFPLYQIGASVPKRSFKKAVDRNRIKRQIREAFRINKNDFLSRIQQSDKKIALMIIFSGREKLDYKRIEAAIVKSLQKIKV